MHVVDACGWLSYFADEGNASFFATPIEDRDHLLVPGIVVYEVCRRLRHIGSEEDEARGFAFMKLGRLVPADWATYRAAAQAARTHKLHMADAIIWQTAQDHGASLYTQDAAFEGLSGVHYRSKAKT